MSAVSSKLVREYLLNSGFDPAVVEWKYFDEQFNRGRERGYVWLNKEKVRGFIGVIPLWVQTDSGPKQMVWTCDWSVEDPAKSPGIGVMLLKKVQADYDHVGGVGGSDFTHAILPRMADHTVADAAIFLHLPLRLGFLLQKLEQRMRWLPKLSRTAMARMPVRCPRSISQDPQVTLEAGVSDAVATLFEAVGQGEPRPVYDRAFLDWQVGRSPHLRTLSCFAGVRSDPKAGALFWTLDDDPRSWRAAFRFAPGAANELETVISAVARFVRSKGGEALSVVISHLDAELLTILMAQRFLVGPVRWPLYLLSRSGNSNVTDLAGLSYLDTDMASRF